MNLALAGNRITIGPNAVIQNDALISGTDVINNGEILGNLTVRAQSFLNTGTAGHLDFQRAGNAQGIMQIIGALGILMALGFLILGLILLKLFPLQFLRVEEEIRLSSAKKTVVGFFLIIASAIIIMLLAVSIIGFPFAIFAGLLFIVALILSTLFVSFALGRMLADRLNFRAGNVWLFILGFIVLNILFMIPVLGGLIWIIAVSLGFGAIYYAIRSRAQPAKIRTRK